MGVNFVRSQTQILAYAFGSMKMPDQFPQRHLVQICNHGTQSWFAYVQECNCQREYWLVFALTCSFFQMCASFLLNVSFNRTTYAPWIGSRLIFTSQTKPVERSAFFKVPQAKNVIYLAFCGHSAMHTWYEATCNDILSDKSIINGCQLRLITVTKAFKCIWRLENARSTSTTHFGPVLKPRNAIMVCLRPTMLIQKQVYDQYLFWSVKSFICVLHGPWMSYLSTQHLHPAGL